METLRELGQDIISHDVNGVIEPPPITTNTKKRGKGIDWIELEDENHDEIVFATFDDVQNQVNKLSLSKIGEKSEKVYRYRCRVKSCPYKVRFTKRDYIHIKGFVSSSHGEHNHNGGHNYDDENRDDLRGLNGLQKKYVRQAFNLGIKSTGQILKYFERERYKSAEPNSFPGDPERTKLTNYASSLKKKVIGRVAGEENWYTGPEIHKHKAASPSTACDVPPVLSPAIIIGDHCTDIIVSTSSSDDVTV